MVALTEASTLWILEMKVAAAVELFLLCKKGGGIPSGPLTSISGPQHPKPCSYCFSTEHCKLIFINLPPFASKSPSSPNWKVTSHLPR